MGTSTWHYVMIGSQVNDKFNDDDGKIGSQIDVVTDGMNGEYEYIGKVIAKSSDARWDSGAFDEAVKLPVQELVKIIDELKQNELYQQYSGEAPQLIIFSHYS